MSDSVRHAYDPAKAHEYYMRTRQLKGRKPGSAATTTATSTASSTAQTTTNAASQRKSDIAARVAALKAKLEKLEAVFRQIADQAERVAGPTKEEPEKDTKAKKGAKEKKTAEQKRKDAKAAKERYEKEKKRTPGGAEAEAIALENDIKAVQAKIEFARNALKASVERARASAAHGTPLDPPKPTSVAHMAFASPQPALSLLSSKGTTSIKSIMHQAPPSRRNS